MTLGSSHVHKARTVLNSRYSHKGLLILSGCSKADIKRKFESAMTIFKVRDHRTYAQVLLSKHDNGHKSDTGCITAHHTTLQGDQNALRQLVLILIPILLRSREVVLVSTNRTTIMLGITTWQTRIRLGIVKQI